MRFPRNGWMLWRVVTKLNHCSTTWRQSFRSLNEQWLITKGVGGSIYRGATGNSYWRCAWAASRESLSAADPSPMAGTAADALYLRARHDQRRHGAHSDGCPGLIVSSGRLRCFPAGIGVEAPLVVRWFTRRRWISHRESMPSTLDRLPRGQMCGDIRWQRP